ncbi:TolC family protein [Verrucomicrobia bacterium]|nr:TolC family protein [Verrucomicrobiota bacterium]
MRQSLHIVGLFFVLFALTGCRGTPEKLDSWEPLSPPQAWTSPTGSTATLVENVGFEELQPPELQTLIRITLEKSPTVRSMIARLDAAAATARLANAEGYPSIGFGLSGGENRQNFIGLPIPGSDGDVLSTQFRSFGWNMNATWEWDLWGRLRAGKQAAALEFQAQDKDFAFYQLSLATQVAKAWSLAVTAQAQWELAQASSASQRQSADSIQARYLKGLQTSLEYRISMQASEVSQALLQARRVEKENALRLLQAFTGHYPDGNLGIASSLPIPNEALPSGLPSELLQRRPDLKAAEWRLLATDKRLYEARKALYPRLSITGSAGGSTAEMRDLLDTEFSVWNLAGNVVQPLFQGGRLLAGIDFSKAKRREALADYHASVLNAFSEVETGLQSDHWLRVRHGHLEMAVEHSRASLKLSETRYARGLVDLSAVLESQRHQLADMSQLLELRRQWYSNRIELLLALGGGVADKSMDMTAKDYE